MSETESDTCRSIQAEAAHREVATRLAIVSQEHDRLVALVRRIMALRALNAAQRLIIEATEELFDYVDHQR